MITNESTVNEMKSIIMAMNEASKQLREELMLKHESFLVRLPKDLKKLKIPISDEVIEVLNAQPGDIVRVTVELEKPKQTAPEPKTAFQIFETTSQPVYGVMVPILPKPFTIVPPFNEPTDDSKTATTRKTGTRKAEEGNSILSLAGFSPGHMTGVNIEMGDFQK